MINQQYNEGGQPCQSGYYKIPSTILEVTSHNPLGDVTPSVSVPTELNNINLIILEIHES